MRIQTFIILFTILIGLNSSAQDLTCKDFKIGKFYIPTTEELKTMTIVTSDSIKNFRIELDSTVNKTVIDRKEKNQIEWENRIGNGNPEYEIIDWIDDCTYRLTYDESKTELDDQKKWINANNGIVVSKTKIEGRCMFYNATMTTTEGRAISQKGIICKE